MRLHRGSYLAISRSIVPYVSAVLSLPTVWSPSSLPVKHRSTTSGRDSSSAMNGSRSSGSRGWRTRALNTAAASFLVSKKSLGRWMTTDARSPSAAWTASVSCDWSVGSGGCSPSPYMMALMSARYLPHDSWSFVSPLSLRVLRAFASLSASSLGVRLCFLNRLVIVSRLPCGHPLSLFHPRIDRSSPIKDPRPCDAQLCRRHPPRQPYRCRRLDDALDPGGTFAARAVSRRVPLASGRSSWTAPEREKYSLLSSV